MGLKAEPGWGLSFLGSFRFFGLGCRGLSAWMCLGDVRSEGCRVMRLVMRVREEPQVGHNRRPFGKGHGS